MGHFYEEGRVSQSMKPGILGGTQESKNDELATNSEGVELDPNQGTFPVSIVGNLG